MHQTTSLAAGFRKSLEGYRKAGFRKVEFTAPLVFEFVGKEGLPAARRLLSDLGLQPVSGGSVLALAEPGPARPQALEELRRIAGVMAELGVDRLVCPCVTSAKFAIDDYKRAADNLREAGQIAKQYNMTVMLEFTRGCTFIGTLATALKVTRKAAHPNVKLIFDFYHFLAGMSRLDELELLVPGELHHVHFQDVPDLPREMLDLTTRAVPGEGIGPLDGVLRALIAKGYKGPFSVELFLPEFQNGDPEAIATRIRKSAEPILRRASLI
jgi:4-hydroxyphenylpyruvate dioxygenase